MATTLKDIAEDCGVSIPTAYQALNGRGKLSQLTRQRVQASAERLGYRPNTVARLLRGGKTNTVVIAYVSEVGRGVGYGYATPSIAERLGRDGYRVEVRTEATNAALMQLLVDLVRAHSADAYILWGVEPEVEEQGLLLESLDQPFIARGYYEDRYPSWAQVDFDHRGMMIGALESLRSLGHDCIGYIGHVSQATYAQNFHRAYSEFMSAHLRHAVPEEWMLVSHESLESSRQIHEQIKNWAQLSPRMRPTAIACGLGGKNIGVIESSLLSLGIRIGNEPGQFAVAGIVGISDRLITGVGSYYLLESEGEMARLMVERQLMPLLRGKPPAQKILRHLPALTTPELPFDMWRSGRVQLMPMWHPEV